MPGRNLKIASLLLAFATIALGQRDALRVTSPDGRIEVWLYLAQPPEPGSLTGLAYQVSFRGKLLIDTSYMGLQVLNQEPMLGENVGLVTSSSVTSMTGSADSRYNSLVAEYMQNGSLGRRITVEVRAFNDGVAFRYLIPRSTPLDELLIENELTEFRFAQDAEALGKIRPESPIALPFISEQPGVGWVSIAEAPLDTFGRMYLTHVEGRKAVARLTQSARRPSLAFAGATPMTCPWRVLFIGATRARLTDSKLLSNLK